jgi:hypothetical protein
LKKAEVINALAAKRARDIWDRDPMRQEPEGRAKETIAVIDEYSKGGAKYPVRDVLQRVRHARLAHRDTKELIPAGPSPADEEIETFYLDNSKIIRLLLTTVKGFAYYQSDSSDIWRVYSNYFWSGARGERTEGHPNYSPRFAPIKANEKAGQAMRFAKREIGASRA